MKTNEPCEQYRQKVLNALDDRLNDRVKDVDDPFCTAASAAALAPSTPPNGRCRG